MAGDEREINSRSESKPDLPDKEATMWTASFESAVKSGENAADQAVTDMAGPVLHDAYPDASYPDPSYPDAPFPEDPYLGGAYPGDLGYAETFYDSHPASVPVPGDQTSTAAIQAQPSPAAITGAERPAAFERAPGPAAQQLAASHQRASASLAAAGTVQNAGGRRADARPARSTEQKKLMRHIYHDERYHPDPREFDGRMPPSNIEAEKSVLGCCMTDYEVMNRVTAILRAEHFYEPRHQVIYDTIQNLSMSGKAVDVLTVSTELERKDLLEACGGNTYIMALPDAAPLIGNATHYADLVYQAYLLRQLLLAVDDVRVLTYTKADNANELLDYASRKIYEIRANDTVSGMEAFHEILGRSVNEIAAMARGERKTHGVPTGYPSLDRALSGGFRGGSLNIVAARPGMGKSALALNIAMKASTLHDIPVVIFSLEMSKEEISNRIISGQARIDSRKIRTGDIKKKDWEDISRAVTVLFGAKIHIDDRTNNTPMEMLSKCRQLKMEGKCGLVIIDYLQLMSSHKRTENRQQEISDISRSLKVMAKELNVPVIALSQLSRATEARKDAKPMLSDLRESGAIEQDADSVIFIYREDYYKTEEVPKEMEEAMLTLAKNRAGATGTIKLGWLPSYTLFVEMSNMDDPGYVYDGPGAIPPPDAPPFGMDGPGSAPGGGIDPGDMPFDL